MAILIDYHSHILPKMDDGAQSSARSLDMLKMMRESGIDMVFATPHFYASDESLDEFLRRRQGSYERLREVIAESGEKGLPLIKLGAELSYYRGIGRSDSLSELCLEGSSIILIEMPFGGWDEDMLDEIIQLKDRDYTPLIAHVERYFDFGNENAIDYLAENEIDLQVNAGSLLGPDQKEIAGYDYDQKNRGRVLELVKSGRAKYLGSDCHNLTNRRPNLKQGFDVLNE